MADSSDLLGSLLQQLGGDGVAQIARSAGVSGGDVTSVLAGAVPAMMSGLTRNAASSGGASALLGALDRDHDGSVLDDVMGYLGGGGNIADGAGILGHVFGGRQEKVEQAVSRTSGVDMGSVTKIMAMMAPLIMGSLGKAKRQQGFDRPGWPQHSVNKSRSPARLRRLRWTWSPACSMVTVTATQWTISRK